MPLVDVNYLAVMAATVVALALGAVWYSSVLFGPRSIRLPIGIPGLSSADPSRPHRAGQVAFVSILCHLVMALMVAVLMSLTGFGTPVQGLLLGFLVWLGFAAPLGLTGNVVSQKGIGTWFIDTGYQLLSLLIMGAILGAWRQWS